MTIQEVCTELRAECKPYALVKMRRDTYSKTLRNIYLGKAKPATIKAFFEKFAYAGEYNSWHKVGYIQTVTKEVYGDLSGNFYTFTTSN
jgi:hypothetical protein